MNRTTTTLVAALAGALTLPAAAGAHVTATPNTAPAGDYAAFTLRVGHGCEDSPTTKLTVQMPDQVVSATPEDVPGWTVRTREGQLSEPFDSHGETITEGVREVTWTGGPLDPHQYREFGLSVRFAGEPGDVVAFKTIQTCEQGENAWIQVAEPGQDEPESPAPTVTLVAAEDRHGAAGEEQAATEATSAQGGTPMAAAATDDGPSTGLVVAALAVGALGLLAGLAALVSARRRTS